MGKIFLLAFFSIPHILFAQNIEELSLEKGVDITGSVNLNTVAYSTWGIENRRDPFNFFFTGNLNLNLFGFDAPFSFSYSNANSSFSQPFNQFSLSPRYKWVQAHLGYSSMTFSPYTLAGHVFLGGGVELTPGKWRVSMMYGRLRKAVPFDPNDSLQVIDGSFKRMGYGLKVGYENNGDLVSFNIFTAKDDPQSIPFVLPESNLTAQQNIAAGINFRKTFFDNLFVEGEYAISALNKDIQAIPTAEDSVARSSNLIGGLLPENSTQRYYDALNAGIGYTGRGYSVKVQYERVAPEYESLGAYYFNNDMENITIVPTVQLLKGRLNFAGNFGIQRNNLDDARAATTKRLVGSLNATFMPNEKWNYALNYSNFSSYTNMRPQQDPFFQNTLDTLDFYQVSQTANALVSRMLGTAERPQSVMINVSFQRAADQADYEGGDLLSTFLNLNASYNMTFTESGTTIGMAINLYTNNAAGTETNYFGPTLNLTKSMADKKLRAALSSSYNQTSGTVDTSPVFNNRINVAYSPNSRDSQGGSQHNLSAGINILNRLKETDSQPKFSELTATVNYTYSF